MVTDPGHVTMYSSDVLVLRRILVGWPVACVAAAAPHKHLKGRKSFMLSVVHAHCLP